MKKRILAVVLGAVMVMSLAGCGSGTSGEDKKASSDGEKTYTIGISQFAEHGSLDNCREGFLEGLKEEGIEEGKNLTVSVKNAAADQGTAKQISDSFVSDKVDLICAIATPSHRAHIMQQWIKIFRLCIQQLLIRLQQSLRTRMVIR